jgi:hypothetical protein
MTTGDLLAKLRATIKYVQSPVFQSLHHIPFSKQPSNLFYINMNNHIPFTSLAQKKEETFLTTEKQGPTYINPQTKSLPHPTLSTTKNRQSVSLPTRPITICRDLLQHRSIMALNNR